MSAVVAYTVRAELASGAVAQAWLAWMESHVGHVINGGALSAQVVRLDGDDAPVICEARYLFASREAFGAYERNVAPRLRAEGLATFPVGSGVALSRTLGEVVIAR